MPKHTPESGDDTLPDEVLVDPRAGSRDLVPHLRTHGMPVSLANPQLEFGDIAFYGWGKDGPLRIGIEHKSIRDLLASMRDKRLSAHQIPGMVAAYEISYLIVQGITRESPDNGVIEHPTGGHVWRELHLGQSRVLHREMTGFLTSLEELAGVRVRWAADVHASAVIIRDLHHWWQKPWEDHKALTGIHNYPSRTRAATVAMMDPPLTQKVATLLPGVGWEKSIAVSDRFRSIPAMVCASEGDWREVDGIGKTLARRIVDALTKEY